MTRKVLIDSNKLGWAKKSEVQIGKDYPEILYVGDEGSPGQNAEDVEIAAFCKENSCDLLTGDQRAYTKLLQQPHVKAVQISKYAHDDDARQQVYLIKTL